MDSLWTIEVDVSSLKSEPREHPTDVSIFFFEIFEYFEDFLIDETIITDIPRDFCIRYLREDFIVQKCCIFLKK